MILYDYLKVGSKVAIKVWNYFRSGNLTEYRDSITVDKSDSGNLTANTSHTNLNVKENNMNAQNRIYSAPIHMRNNSKHGTESIIIYTNMQ